MHGGGRRDPAEVATDLQTTTTALVPLVSLWICDTLLEVLSQLVEHGKMPETLRFPVVAVSLRTFSPATDRLFLDHNRTTTVVILRRPRRSSAVLRSITPVRRRETKRCCFPTHSNYQIFRSPNENDARSPASPSLAHHPHPSSDQPTRDSHTSTPTLPRFRPRRA